ncbi:hypothetical protein CFP56_038358 [Quercus suber]|uniref:HMG box domain-containing protein n=1 Tax=Quercus suber TaxID=58331 RepID=A0AAW0J278_QUESU
MHECESKKELAVKRFRGVCGRQSVVTESQSHTIGDQPRENFLKTCKSRNLISIDQAGFDIWKNMSKEEREPYIIEAKRVNSSYMKALLGEVNNMQEVIHMFKQEFMIQLFYFTQNFLDGQNYKVNDEADSAMVGKFDRCPTNFLNFMKQMVESRVIEKSDLSSSLRMKCLSHTIRLWKAWLLGSCYAMHSLWSME